MRRPAAGRGDAKTMTRILGISAYYHDSAAALLSRRRSRGGGPGGALHPQEARPALPRAGASSTASPRPASACATSTHVVFYDKPLVKFERLLETYLSYAPRGLPLLPGRDAGLAQGEAVPEDARCKRELAALAGCKPTRSCRSCCSPSTTSRTRRPRSTPARSSEAAVLCLDGVGEWATTSAWRGQRQRTRSRCGKSTFRTRSACCTRRSPTSPASR